MSQVSANTPKRQAIVDRLKQRIDSFRKHHDDCQTRLEKTQPSRELKQRQESQILHTKFMENIKVKTNAKLRHDQMNQMKIAKQEALSGHEKSASSNNTLGLQSSMKRRNEFSPPHMQTDGERTIQTSEADLGPPVPPKYSRYDRESRNGVHCKIKPNFDDGSEAQQQAGHSLPYNSAAVNGHDVPEFQAKSEEGTTTSVASYTVSDERAGQQYATDEFAASSTFPNRVVANENSLASDFPNFKKESVSAASSKEDHSGTLPNGFQDTKSEENFDRLLTDFPKSEDDDLESQISEFERVFQGIKNQDRGSSDCETNVDDITTSTLLKNAAASVPLGNGLNDSVGKGNNQLALSNEANNGPAQLASGVHQQQHGTISRATAQAVNQFIRTQQEERMTKVRYEKNYLLHSQSIPTTDQNVPRLPQQRPNHNLAAIRQRVYEQIQSRRTNQQKSKMLRSPAQLQARNPVISAMQAGSSPYQVHPGYFGPNATQPSFSPRVRPNIMAHLQQQSPQMQGTRHHLNVYTQQQKLAFQQMASHVPSQQPRADSSSMMDIRQKLSAGGIYTSPSGQYPVQPQVARTPQPLSHLQHYPNTYPNPPPGAPTRPMQASYGAGEYSTYQNPYGYNMNQDTKLHPAYQRHASVDESMTVNRFQDMSNRTNFNYQRSSSLPGPHGSKSTFNQTAPPVARLGHNKLPADMNNNEHHNQELGHLHPTSQHAPLTHMKHPTNNLAMSQEHVYQGNNLLAQTRSAQTTTGNLQPTFSNSFTNLLDLKSNSESSLFPFLGQDVCATSTENTDFDSLLKSPPADFNLLNILESEPKKAL